MKMKKFSILLALTATSWVTHGQTNPVNPDQQDRAQDVQLNTITTAVPFLDISHDSRSGAMGDVGVAISPDANAVYWNSSKLVFSEKDVEFTMSYVPWLRALVDDIHLSYLAGYKKLGDRHAIGGSLRYFSLGNITFTDAQGNTTRDFNPNEFALTGTYSFRLSENFAMGLNGKFIYSNLTGGITVQGADSRPGIAGAADLNFSYFNEGIRLGSKDLDLSFGGAINNIGNKMTYTNTADRDFIPTNLKLGTSGKIHFDQHNSLTVSLDLSKLLVPTPPVYLVDEDGDLVTDSQGDRVIGSGRDPEVGVAVGMVQSFYDAPGQVLIDENGEPLFLLPDGQGYQIQDGSRFREELREINLGVGLEYWYDQLFAFRTGFFFEHPSKGNRRFWTVGAGLQYNVFGLDFSYLASFQREHPLANTLRFTLHFKFDKGALRGSNGDKSDKVE